MQTGNYTLPARPHTVSKLIGKRYGKLVVHSFIGMDGSGYSNWMCKCDCGNSKIVQVRNLGRCTNSCGCLQIESVKRTGYNNTKHKTSDDKKKAKREKDKRNRDRRVGELREGYLIKRIKDDTGINPDLITKEMVEIKRLLILTHRITHRKKQNGHLATDNS